MNKAMGLIRKLTEVQNDFLHSDDLIEIKPIEVRSVFTKDSRKLMFSIVGQMWKEVFNPKELTVLVNQSANENNFQKSKLIRRQAGILRSAYLFFDERHESPESHTQLYYYLGQFNDFYFKAEREKYAIEVIRAIENVSLTTGESDYIPATDESFIARLEDILIWIEAMAPKGRFSVEAFHDLRKAVRYLMNLATFPFLMTGEKNFGLMKHLLIIVQKMGKEHDDIVQVAQPKEGEITVYLDSTITRDIIKIPEYFVV